MSFLLSTLVVLQMQVVCVVFVLVLQLGNDRKQC